MKVEITKEGWLVDGKDIVEFGFQAKPEKSDLEKKLQKFFDEGGVAEPQYTEGEKKLNAIKNSIMPYILKHYPDDKQKSDTADVTYWRAEFEAADKDPSKIVVPAARKIAEGKSTIEKEVKAAKLGKELSFGMVQLIKVALRVGWVQRVKQEWYRAVQAKEEPNYPPFPEL